MKADLALAAQVRRVVAMSVDGNPRQIKRFLNAFRLRLIMAKARNVTLDPRIAAKLMLLSTSVWKRSGPLRIGKPLMTALPFSSRSY